MTDRTALDVVLGRYALGEVLGHGGSATVYRAWDRHTGRAVALKRFAHGAGGPDRHRQRAEVRTLARLDHPGLVRLLDAGAEDGRAHLVTDLVEGPTLAQRLAQGCLPVVEVAALGASLAEALAHIHAEGITHRDVKPANVLLDPLHGPRLADFGIARLVDATRVTATDAVVGTAAYMAPEQLRGGEVGPAADVYALGLVLLEAATGGLGLPGTGLEVVLTRLHIPPSVPAGLPGPLRTLLQTMTDGSPRRRPSARQVATALAGVDEDVACAERGIAPAARTTTPSSRHRTAVVVLGLLGVGGVVRVPAAPVGARPARTAHVPASSVPSAAGAPRTRTNAPAVEGHEQPEDRGSGGGGGSGDGGGGSSGDGGGSGRGGSGHPGDG